VAGVPHGRQFAPVERAYAILRSLPKFVAGLLLYSAYERCASASVLGTDTLLFVLILALGAMLHLSAPDLSIIALFPLLILTAVRNKGQLGRLLNSRLLLWLGNISYSLYLLHWFVLSVIMEGARLSLGFALADVPLRTSLLVVAAMMGVSLGLATLSYRFIEVAGRRWLRERLDTGWGRGIIDRAGLPSGSRA
jgi:peptidoglycan/LPS O-acetylase OafA/YrhL